MLPSCSWNVKNFLKLKSICFIQYYKLISSSITHRLFNRTELLIETLELIQDCMLISSSTYLFQPVLHTHLIQKTYFIQYLLLTYLISYLLISSSITHSSYPGLHTYLLHPVSRTHLIKLEINIAKAGRWRVFYFNFILKNRVNSFILIFCFYVFRKLFYLYFMRYPNERKLFYFNRKIK